MYIYLNPPSHFHSHWWKFQHLMWKLPHWVLKKLNKFTYYPNWKFINRNIWTVELRKICLCFRGNNNIMKENFVQWYVPNLWKKAVLIFATLQDFLVYLQLCLIQQILTEQKRSFIKGLSNKDSIELLRHNDFFLLLEDVFFGRDYDQLGLSFLLPLHYHQGKHKLEWYVGEDCFISFRIRTLVLL